MQLPPLIHRLRRQRKQFVLVGNYGIGNFGDDALHAYFLQHFSDIPWISVSARAVSPHVVPRLPIGFRSFFSTSWWRTVFAIARSDGLVFGGGSLFTDTESLWACVLWGFHGLVAYLFGRPIMLAFQGIGPFRTRLGEGIARWLIRKSVYISVRDSLSYSRISSWPKNTKVIQSFDPVFSLIEADKIGVRTNILIVIPRMNSSQSFLNKFIELYNRQSWDKIIILRFEPSHPGEQSITREILAAMPSTQRSSVRDITDYTSLLSSMEGASCVLTHRYHGAIAALALGLDLHVVSQGEGDKLSALSQVLTTPLPELRARCNEGERTLCEALMQLS